MEQGAVAAGAEGAEQGGFARVGVGQHGKRLVGVAGDDDLVVAPRFAGGVMHRHAAGVAADRLDFPTGEDAAFERGCEVADIFA